MKSIKKKKKIKNEMTLSHPNKEKIVPPHIKPIDGHLLWWF